MKRDVVDYVSKCLICQQVKADHQLPGGLLKPLGIPEWKWECVAFDFVSGLPRSFRKNDSIWVVVDRLTKSVHLIPLKVSRTAEQLAQLYMDNIVRYHRIPREILSDRDPLFTSHSWRAFQQALGTKVRLSTAYHPQTDGQTERTIQTLEDLLRSCILEWGGDWEQHLPLVEFTHNNSYQASIGMAPFEALYGRPCRTPSCWLESADVVVVGPQLLQDAVEQVNRIKLRMKTAQDRQKSYADVRRKKLEFQVGDNVYLKISPTKGTMRFGFSGKLKPRYIGPFDVIRRVGELAYELALPPSLDKVHNVFHVSMIKKYVRDPNHILPDYRELNVQPDATYEEKPLRILARRDKVLRRKTIPLVKVLWSRRRQEEASWEKEEDMRKEYPELF